MPRPRHSRDGSEYSGPLPRPCRGRDGSDHEGMNRRSHRGRDRSDHADTMHRSRHGRDRSDFSSRSDRVPPLRKRSRTRCGSLAPLRGYCKIHELRKAEREKRLTALALTKALEAQKYCRKTITDLAHENRSLSALICSMSKELSRALQSTSALQYGINELAQRSRTHELIDHCVKRAKKSMVCENTSGVDDLSGHPSLSVGDDSIPESDSVKLVPSQSRNQPEAVKEAAVVTIGGQQEMSTLGQTESSEQLGDKVDAQKDVEQSVPPENSIDGGVGRPSLPSLCGEPRASAVGGAFQ